MSVARHPLFWLLDMTVAVATYRFWGFWDSVVTVAVVALGFIEGYVTKGEEGIEIKAAVGARSTSCLPSPPIAAKRERATSPR